MSGTIDYKDGMKIFWDVAIEMDDGLKIRSIQQQRKNGLESLIFSKIFKVTKATKATSATKAIKTCCQAKL